MGINFATDRISQQNRKSPKQMVQDFYSVILPMSSNNDMSLAIYFSPEKKSLHLNVLKPLAVIQLRSTKDVIITL